MSICCMHANFGKNPVISPGYIVHILMIHANISADNDAYADGISITVYASHSNFSVRYKNLSYSLFSICSKNSRKDDTQHTIFENTMLLFKQFRP